MSQRVPKGRLGAMAYQTIMNMMEMRERNLAEEKDLIVTLAKRNSRCISIHIIEDRISKAHMSHNERRNSDGNYFAMFLY